MTSVDGRIDCPMVGQLSTDEYYIALEKLGPCSKLSGRITTALECSAVKGESTPMEGTQLGHKSVYVASKSDEYTIIVDTYGKLRWQEGEADGYPLLCIVSERVSEEYLETLRTLGISWIAAGAERIDLPGSDGAASRTFRRRTLGDCRGRAYLWRFPGGRTD